MVKSRFGSRWSKALLIVSLTFIAWIASASIYDVLIPMVYRASCPSSDVIVIDVTNVVKSVGVPIVKGLTIPQFLTLGKCKAKYVIIVSHGLKIVNSVFLPKGSFALETSERASITTLFLYPLYVLNEGVVRGRSFESSSLMLAVTERIAPFMYSLNGKVVILVTCPMGNVTRFAEALISRGCSMVAYPRFDVFENSARELVTKIVMGTLNSNSLSDLARYLRTLGFVTIGNYK